MYFTHGNDTVGQILLIVGGALFVPYVFISVKFIDVGKYWQSVQFLEASIKNQQFATHETRTTTDSDGNTKREEIKVVSSTHDHDVKIEDFVDVSANINLQQPNGKKIKRFLKIYTRGSYLPIDRETSDAFNWEKQQFIDQNKHRDTHWNCYTTYNLEGMNNRVIRIDRMKKTGEDQVEMPWEMTINATIIATFLLMGFLWNYHVSTSFVQGRRYTSHKLLSVNPLSPAYKDNLFHQKQDYYVNV